MNKRRTFLKTILKDHKVAAISRSSKYVVRNVLKSIPSGTQTIIEYGAGDGVMTQALLAQLPENARLLAIESNADFVDLLLKIDDPRLHIVHATAQEASNSLAGYGFPQADIIVSSIPFSLLSKQDRILIIANTFAALVPDGRFIAFHQYSPLILPLLRKRFKKAKAKFELRNIFPCFILSAQK